MRNQHGLTVTALAFLLSLQPLTGMAGTDKVKVVNKVRTKIVNSSNDPVAVKGEVALEDPVEIEGTVDVRVVSTQATGPRRVQFELAAAFQEGQDIAGPVSGSFPPQEMSVPGSDTLLIEYVSCRAAVNAGQQLDISFVVPVFRNGSSIARRPYTASLQKVATRDSFGTQRDTVASNEKVSICVGGGCDTLTSNTSWGGQVEIEGRRNTTAGFARVDCVIGGILESS